ncbi:hypothetical protein BC6307_13835 [Sutcliffiella cohnii]|uniref:Transcobalamin-like C-terminal domain-containing protein n=1 Tax=Sutcliffiella cohnii TaxID=33932 RepID=A0A223KXY6_9BACI|nr:DUF4430 domain-containing protein [Sutcliffiella cohnii]AST94355.1 hypothetical protein BC6307_13835 [Sutcliffiella cohnii]
MKKIWISLLVAISLIVTGCAADNTNNTNNNANAGVEQNEEVNKVTIKLVKDNGEEVISEEALQFEEGETLMDVMHEHFELTTDDSGAFIVGINGIESDYENNYFWIYTANNEEVLVGANEYVLKDGDVIEFNYSKYEG